jgi:hypothetical protein
VALPARLIKLLAESINLQMKLPIPLLHVLDKPLGVIRALPGNAHQLAVGLLHLLVVWLHTAKVHGGPDYHG